MVFPTECPGTVSEGIAASTSGKAPNMKHAPNMAGIRSPDPFKNKMASGKKSPMKTINLIIGFRPKRSESAVTTMPEIREDKPISPIVLPCLTRVVLPVRLIPVNTLACLTAKWSDKSEKTFLV